MTESPDSAMARVAEELSVDGEHRLTALLPSIYDQLRALSSALLGGAARQHTLQPTALVHEAWLRLAHHGTATTDDRLGFLRVAAKTMRHILINHAAARNADKRGGGRRPLDIDEVTAAAAAGNRPLDVLALDEALRALRAHDQRMANVVELRFFAGCTTAEAAAALEVSCATVERSWRFARAWLKRQLDADLGADVGTD